MDNLPFLGGTPAALPVKEPFDARVGSQNESYSKRVNGGEAVTSLAEVPSWMLVLLQQALSEAKIIFTTYGPKRRCTFMGG